MYASGLQSFNDVSSLFPMQPTPQQRPATYPAPPPVYTQPAQVVYVAPNKTSTALTLQGATGVSSTDFDQLAVFDGKAGTPGTKSFWLNERGNPRCKAADDNEVALRVIQSSTTQAANILEVNDYTNAAQFVRVGPAGTLIVNSGFRLTAGTLGANKVLASDASGNGSWQPWGLGIPSGASAPATPAVGDLWADPS